MSSKEIFIREIGNLPPHAQILEKGTAFDKIASHVGTLSDADAQELKNLINNNFEKIEGKWETSNKYITSNHT